MTNWQPIETAPKDGTWILVYAPPKEYIRDTRQMYLATWESLYYNCAKEWAYGQNGYEHAFRSGAYDVTHWMPLPKPPVAEVSYSQGLAGFFGYSSSS